LGKLQTDLRLELKFQTDNVRQRSCVGETVPTVARPTLTHNNEKKEGDKHVRNH